MKHLFLVAAIALVGCKQEADPVAQVTFKTICGGCIMESSAGGGTTDFILEKTQTFSVGEEVYIRATPTHPSDTTTMVSVLVNGFQQAMEYNGIVDTTLRPVEVRLLVPELNKYGERQ